jgi:hypothetical protein
MKATQHSTTGKPFFLKPAKGVPQQLSSNKHEKGVAEQKLA